MTETKPKVELLVSEWCASCHQAEKVWSRIAEEREIDYAVVDMGQPEGRELVQRLRLKTVPAVVIDGELKGVGVQTPDQAREWVQAAPERKASGTRHIGLGLEATSRFAILSATVYLVIAGAALPFGGLLLDGTLRGAVIHLFGVGFVTFMIYGLGEHMLPRFTGNAIRLGAWSWAQLGLTHGGLLALVAGAPLAWSWLVGAGQLAIWVGLAVFTLRVWPLLWPGGLRELLSGPEETEEIRSHG